MERISSIEPSRSFKSPVVTIGNFDGVHLGHQKIFKLLVQRARQLGGESVVYTFQPHPVKLLHPDKDVPLLTSYEERARLIESFGVDVIISAPFDRKLANRSAREFVARVLHQAIGAREVLVGYDYAFGRGRQGNTELLQELGKSLGFSVKIVSPVMLDGEAVSSSRVRKAVREGDMILANRMLGREFAVEGTVLSGHGRGKSLGYPTANMAITSELIPKTGVYAVRVFLPGRPDPFGGMANLGTNPTFGDEAFSFEVHIFDFQEDLYGKHVRVSLVRRLRDEKRFDSPEALVEQIQRDERASRRLLREKAG